MTAIENPSLATGDDLKQAVAALLAFDSEQSRAWAQLLTHRQVDFIQAADSTSSTTVSEIAMQGPRYLAYADGVRQTFPKSKVIAIIMTCDGSTTANATTYASDTITAYDAAGTTSTVVATINTSPTANGGTGNLSKFVPFIIDASTTPTFTNPIIPAGGFLTFQRAKNSTGVTMPRTIYTIVCEPY